MSEVYVQMTAYSFFEGQQDPRFRVCLTSSDLQEAENFLSRARVIAHDYETDGLAWWAGKRACGGALSARVDGEVRGFYVPYRHRTGQRQVDPEVAVAFQKRFVEDPRVLKVYHNRKFDDHMGRRDGITIAGPCEDTMLAARLYREDAPAGLKERALSDLNDPDAKRHEDLLNLDIVRLAKAMGLTKTAYKDAFGYAALDLFLCGRYAAHDAYLTLRLHEFYEEKGVREYYSRSPRGSDYWGVWDVEMALVEVLCDMEEVGVPVDVDHVRNMSRHLAREKERAELAFFSESGLEYFNLGSDDQLRERLQSKGCKFTKMTSKGNLAMDANVLVETMAKLPFVKWVLRWRDVDKLLSTYTVSLLKFVDEHGVLHGNYRQMGTNTGRLSCGEPNLQNIVSGVDLKFLRDVLGFEKDRLDACRLYESVKRIFVVQRTSADPFFSPRMFRNYSDYSQVELRVIAHYTQDPRLLRTYREGGDVHDEVERTVFDTGKHEDPVTGEARDGPNRRKAKVINFGLSYCMSPIGFHNQLPEVSVEEAEGYFDQYNVNFPEVDAFRKQFWGFVLTNGLCFNSMFGRTRRVPAIASPVWRLAQRAKRQAFATLIQGTAADVMKLSLVRVSRALRDAGLGSRLTGTVHDEAHVDGPVEEFAEVARLLKSVMEDFPDFTVPVVVDSEYSVTHWGDKHPVPGL